MTIRKSKFRLIQIIGLPLLITAILLFAAYAPAAASAQNLFPLNNSNNSKTTTNLNLSSKTITIPQGSKATITTTANPRADGQTNNSQGSNFAITMEITSKTDNNKIINEWPTTLLL